MPKEVVESERKDLSLPPKDECKESSVAEEKENSENKNPTTGTEASKKNKKKKKKAAPATSEEAVDKKGDEVKKEVLGEIVEEENAAEVRHFEMLHIHFLNQLLLLYKLQSVAAAL